MERGVTTQSVGPSGVAAQGESGLPAAVMQWAGEWEYATIALDGSYASLMLDELLGLLAAEMANQPKRRRL